MNQTKNAQQRKPPYNRRWRSTDLCGTHLELELDCGTARRGAAGPGAWPSPSYARAPGGIPKAPSGSEGGDGARADEGWEEWRREWWEGWELGRRGGGAEEERKAVVAWWLSGCMSQRWYGWAVGADSRRTGLVCA